MAFFRNNVPNWKNYSLKKEDLINFYYNKLKEAKIKDVWNNIKNMGYYPDLNKIGCLSEASFFIEVISVIWQKYIEFR